MKDFFKTSRVSIIIVFAIGFFLFGFSLGAHQKTDINASVNLAGKETAVSTSADFSAFWKVWETINEKFPNADKVADQDRVYGAIDGLISSLDDPHSVFFNPEETKRFEEDISGNFSGVGLELGMKDKVITVISPLKDTPAYKAGIKTGDKILKIDGKMTSDIGGVDGAVKLIRGEAGTSVTLTIFREGEKAARDVKIVRGIIDIPTLDTELRSDGIFVIKLYSFSANSANLFKKAIKEFASAKSNKLIIDLRGNPGGYLSAAVDMSSWFVPGGKTVVVEDYGKESVKPKIYRSKGFATWNTNPNIVILINAGSASASEILAGALQDYKLAKLVGEKSYGKGSVQEVVPITNDTIFKVTVAKWLTPLEHMIDGKGLTPDYEVKFDSKDSDAGKDPQMDKAVEVLKNWK